MHLDTFVYIYIYIYMYLYIYIYIYIQRCTWSADSLAIRSSMSRETMFRPSIAWSRVEVGRLRMQS